MNTIEILQQLRAERARLDAAIQALEGIGGVSAGSRRRGRPSGTTNKAISRRRRTMSPAARKRIADAMKKRWAAAKKSGKKRL